MLPDSQTGFLRKLTRGGLMKRLTSFDDPAGQLQVALPRVVHEQDATFGVAYHHQGEWHRQYRGRGEQSGVTVHQS